MTTIRILAAEYDMQPYELAAFLDLGADYSETEEIDSAEETWMRQALSDQHDTAPGWGLRQRARVVDGPDHADEETSR